MTRLYDQERAERAVRFVRALKHTRGRWYGVPFNLAPWQEHEIVRPLFGTVGDDGLRQFRKAYISFPRKNGKSEIGSAIALYMLLADGEMGAEVYSAAGDREQASIVFNTAVEMVKQSPALMRRCRIRPSTRRIIVESTGSFWRVLSAEAYTKHGLNPHAVIFDELHTQPSRDLWDTLDTAFGAREQPLMVALTTAGYDRHSICYEQYSYAKRVLSGEIHDPSFFAAIYEAADDADWTDERVWKGANPALGDFLSLPEMRDMARKAVSMPAFQNTFRRLRLNQWTEQESRWIDMQAWDASAGVVSLQELEGEPCYGGLDLASTTDITALLLLFPREDGMVKMISHFWIPAEQMHDRSNRDRVPYEVWVREGLVTATPGNVVDYDRIERDILAFAERYSIQEIAFDRWNALHIVQHLEDEGLVMVPIGQGFAGMSAPTKEFSARILGERLHHGGNPVLRWMAGNVAVQQDAAGNLKPDKAKSTEKIDGVVAAIMALDRVIRHQGDDESTYEENELVVL